MLVKTRRRSAANGSSKQLEQRASDRKFRSVTLAWNGSTRHPSGSFYETRACQLLTAEMVSSACPFRRQPVMQNSFLMNWPAPRDQVRQCIAVALQRRQEIEDRCGNATWFAELKPLEPAPCNALRRLRQDRPGGRRRCGCSARPTTRSSRGSARSSRRRSCGTRRSTGG
jgi:hypothetical protein